MPALRLLLVFNLLGLGTLALLDALSLGTATLQTLWQHRQQQQGREAGSRKEVEVQIDGAGDLAASSAGDGSEGSSAKLDGSSDASGGQGGQGQNACQHEQGQQAAVAEWRVAQPVVPLQRGLSHRFAGLEARHPRAHRFLAATATAVSIAVAAGCQLVAPGFVDPSIGEWNA